MTRQKLQPDSQDTHDLFSSVEREKKTTGIESDSLSIKEASTLPPELQPLTARWKQRGKKGQDWTRKQMRRGRQTEAQNNSK